MMTRKATRSRRPRSAALRLFVGVFLLLVAVACGSEAASTESSDSDIRVDYGPLAVLPPADGGNDAGAEGTLRVSEHCVYLDSMLLAWPANWVAWNPQTQTIAFNAGFGFEVQLVDGMPIMVGGSTIIGESDNGEPAVEYDEDLWVQPPHDSCDTTEVWGVSGVTLADEAADRSASADPGSYLPNGVLATTSRPDPIVLVAGLLAITGDGGACLTIDTADGSQVGLIWSTGFITWDGVGIEVPGEPARYVESGQEIEVIGDWFDSYANEFDDFATETCQSDRSLWVAEITDGGLTG